MNNVEVAQAVLQKTKKLTPANRHSELKAAFEGAGISISDDLSSVVGVSGAEPFQSLSAALKTTLPTAMISAKRVLSGFDIQV